MRETGSDPTQVGTPATPEHQCPGLVELGQAGASAGYSSWLGERRRRERVLALAALLLIVVAWVIGAIRAEADLMPAIRRAMPEAGHFVKVEDGLYRAWYDRTESQLLGHVAIGEAGGYGGPLRVAAAVNADGEVVGAVIAGHKETYSWIRRISDSGVLSSLVGKQYSDPFAIGNDVDGVTGATCTAQALASAVLSGSRAVARHLDLPLAPSPPPKIVFGIPEIVLLMLFATGYFAHKRSFPYKKQARWTSLLVGLLVLGFIYNLPFTLAHVTKLLLGYWPQWQGNLYWYFLVGGIFLVFTIDNKNPYCQWFCPFGAAQDCMAAIGGAGSRRQPGRYRFFTWLQRCIALAAIVLGIYFRSPGLAGYELFGTLFALVGTSLQLVALGLVLLLSLFITRPWCNYLCPLRPVVDLVRLLREWMKELWQRRKSRTV